MLFVLKKEQKIAKYLLYTNNKFIIIEVVFIEFGIFMSNIIIGILSNLIMYVLN